MGTQRHQPTTCKKQPQWADCFKAHGIAGAGAWNPWGLHILGIQTGLWQLFELLYCYCILHLSKSCEMGLSKLLFISAHSLSGCSIMVEKPRQQEFKKADHISSVLRRARNMVLPITKMGLPKSSNAIKVIAMGKLQCPSPKGFYILPRWITPTITGTQSLLGTDLHRNVFNDF